MHVCALYYIKNVYSSIAYMEANAQTMVKLNLVYFFYKSATLIKKNHISNRAALHNMVANG